MDFDTSNNENVFQEVHVPSLNNNWYPNDDDDNVTSRIRQGYEFNYPRDDKVDGYLIERFTHLMADFYSR